MGLLEDMRIRPLYKFHMAEILGFYSAWIRAFSKHKQGFYFYTQSKNRDLFFYSPSLPMFLKVPKISRMQ